MMPVHSQESFSTYGNCTANTYGFISMEGEAKNIPPVYCDATPFSEGLAAVKHQKKWGYIDADNHAIIGFTFDYAGRFMHGQAIVQQGEFYGVVDKSGKYVIQPEYLDLQLLIIAGKLYYLSRDRSFFAGLIDRTGREVIPHRFTFVLQLEGYPNIPFYTVFQEIDTTKGSFYEQFQENAFQFSPEKGLHTIYDLQFNKLASKPSADFDGGFQHDQLRRINAFLQENGYKSVEEKVAAIDSLLALPGSDPIPRTVDPLHVRYRRMTDDEVARYVDSLGYQFFAEDGKTGLKKRNNIVIRAQHTGLQLVNGTILFPREEGIPILETHYGGKYRNKEKGIYDVFAVVSSSDAPAQNNDQYSLSGTIKLPVHETNKRDKKIISLITSLGFLYLHTTVGAAGEAIKTYSLVNWEGDELLPPVYQKIEILKKSGHILVTQEKESKNGVEEHFGLFNSRGEEIVPVGVYSTILSFTNGCESHYLATWSDPYPTTAALHETRYENKAYVILKVEGSSIEVINTFTASGVYPSHLDVKTGMLWYKKNKH